MNEIINKIQDNYSNGHENSALKILFSSSLEVKLHLIKSGSFLSYLASNNPSFSVKKALIEEGFSIKEFIEDKDWRIRFEILKIYGSQFHDSFDFETEHFENQIQMLKNGFDITEACIYNSHPDLFLYIIENYGYDFAKENDFIEDIDYLPNKVKVFLINNGKKVSINKLIESKESILEIIPKLNEEDILKIFKTSLDDDILKNCIEYSHNIKNLHNHSKIDIFLKNVDNRIWAINKKLYIKNILDKYKDCKKTLIALIKNNYTFYHYDKNKAVIDLLYRFFDSNIANELLFYVNQTILINTNFKYNNIIIKDLIPNITNIQFIDYLKQKTDCLKLLSSLNLRKDYLHKIKYNIDNIDLNLNHKSKFIRNI